MTTSQREQVEASVAAWSSRLAARDKNACATAIMKMLICFPQQAMATELQDAKIGSYMAVVESLPFWATCEACRLWIAGGAFGQDQYKFAPSPAELARAVKDVLRPVLARKQQLERLLAAKIIEQNIVIDRAARLRTLEQIMVKLTDQQAGADHG